MYPDEVVTQKESSRSLVYGGKGSSRVFQGIGVPTPQVACKRCVILAKVTAGLTVCVLAFLHSGRGVTDTFGASRTGTILFDQWLGRRTQAASFGRDEYLQLMRTRSCLSGPDLLYPPSPPRCLQQRGPWRGTRRHMLRGTVQNMWRKGLHQSARRSGALICCCLLPSARAMRQEWHVLMTRLSA